MPDSDHVNCGQEMTLKQFVETLPECHLARKQYESLLGDRKWMNALDAAGVDNWEGYDHAREIMGAS